MALCAEFCYVTLNESPTGFIRQVFSVLSLVLVYPLERRSQIKTLRNSCRYQRKPHCPSWLGSVSLLTDTKFRCMMPWGNTVPSSHVLPNSHLYVCASTLSIYWCSVNFWCENSLSRSYRATIRGSHELVQIYSLTILQIWLTQLICRVLSISRFPERWGLTEHAVMTKQVTNMPIHHRAGELGWRSNCRYQEIVLLCTLAITPRVKIVNSTATSLLKLVLRVQQYFGTDVSKVMMNAITVAVADLIPDEEVHSMRQHTVLSSHRLYTALSCTALYHWMCRSAAWVSVILPLSW